MHPLANVDAHIANPGQNITIKKAVEKTKTKTHFFKAFSVCMSAVCSVGMKTCRSK